MDKPQDYSPIRRYGDCKSSLRKLDHDGWIILDGRKLDRSRYPRFFAALEIIGNDYLLPNMKDALVVGAGGRVKLGNVAGSNTLVLTADNLPEHSHSYKDMTVEPTAGKAGLVAGVLPIVTGSKTVESEKATTKAGTGKPIEIQPIALGLNWFVYVGA